MWIKTTEGEYINTDHLTELSVREEGPESGEAGYSIWGYMPGGLKKHHLILGPLPNKEIVGKRLATLTNRINR